MKYKLAVKLYNQNKTLQVISNATGLTPHQIVKTVYSVKINGDILK